MTTTLVESLSKIYPNLSDSIFTVAAQQMNDELSSSLDSLVQPQGKVGNRPTPKTKVIPALYLT
jgi:hypothetical protein